MNDHSNSNDNTPNTSTPSSMSTTPVTTALPPQSPPAETAASSVNTYPGTTIPLPEVSTSVMKSASQSGTNQESPDFKSTIEPSPTKPNYSKESMGPRAYLDLTVTPILLEGMKLLVQERPEDPLAYLGRFLMSRSEKGKHQQQTDDSMEE